MITAAIFKKRFEDWFQNLKMWERLLINNLTTSEAEGLFHFSIYVTLLLLFSITLLKIALAYIPFCVGNPRAAVRDFFALFQLNNFCDNLVQPSEEHVYT